MRSPEHIVPSSYHIFPSKIPYLAITHINSWRQFTHIPMAICQNRPEFTTTIAYTLQTYIPKWSAVFKPMHRLLLLGAVLKINIYWMCLQTCTKICLILKPELKTFLKASFVVQNSEASSSTFLDSYKHPAFCGKCTGSQLQYTIFYPLVTIEFSGQPLPDKMQLPSKLLSPLSF